MRASSRQLKQSCSQRMWWRWPSAAMKRSGAAPPSAFEVPPPPNTARSMPAEKCLPVDEMTMQRARTLSLMSRTITGSSFQKARIMLLKASGRFSLMCATPPSISTSKQVQGPSAGMAEAGVVLALAAVMGCSWDSSEGFPIISP